MGASRVERKSTPSRSRVVPINLDGYPWKDQNVKRTVAVLGLHDPAKSTHHDSLEILIKDISCALFGSKALLKISLEASLLIL